MQLGGPRVMGENGVSHYVVNDDLEGVKVILRWLSYCPAQLGAEPPLLPTNDPVDRPVAYEPAVHEKFDPRAAIMGKAWLCHGVLANAFKCDTVIVGLAAHAIVLLFAYCASLQMLQPVNPLMCVCRPRDHGGLGVWPV